MFYYCNNVTTGTNSPRHQYTVKCKKNNTLFNKRFQRWFQPNLACQWCQHRHCIAVGLLPHTTRYLPQKATCRRVLLPCSSIRHTNILRPTDRQCRKNTAECGHSPGHSVAIHTELAHPYTPTRPLYFRPTVKWDTNLSRRPTKRNIACWAPNSGVNKDKTPLCPLI